MKNQISTIHGLRNLIKRNYMNLYDTKVQQKKSADLADFFCLMIILLIRMGLPVLLLEQFVQSYFQVLLKGYEAPEPL
jgi:hypothetical protein